MAVVEQVLVAERACDGHAGRFGEGAQRARCPRHPIAGRRRCTAAREPRRAAPSRARRRRAPGRVGTTSMRGRSATSARATSMSSGSASTTGTRAPGERAPVRLRDVLRDALDAVDLGRPTSRRCRTCAGSRPPGTPRGRACRCRPGRRAPAAASSPVPPRGCRSRRWTPPGRGSPARRPGRPVSLP